MTRKLLRNCNTWTESCRETVIRREMCRSMCNFRFFFKCDLSQEKVSDLDLDEAVTVERWKDRRGSPFIIARMSMLNDWWRTGSRRSNNAQVSCVRTCNFWLIEFQATKEDQRFWKLKNGSIGFWHGLEGFSGVFVDRYQYQGLCSEGANHGTGCPHVTNDLLLSCRVGQSADTPGWSVSWGQ